MKRPWLTPLTPLYAAGVTLRNLRIEKGWETVRRLRWPVVSVGNLSTGGSGKTPLTIALAKLLIGNGFHVDVLSRGYGRRSRLAARVRMDGDAVEFGDEPLLMAREARVPVYVAAQRYEAGRLAEAEAHSTQHHAVHLLDDGFQHRQLARDVDILLLNLEDWQEALLPAGNLREPLQSARRASVLAIPADEPELEAAIRAWGWQGPVWRLRRRMRVPAMDGPVAAFCGIARPQQFFAGLEAAGLHLAARIAFPDHYRYSAADLERLAAAADKAGAVALITTEKDLVRLGGLTGGFAGSLPLKVARLEIEIENEAAALDWLASRLSTAPSLPSL
jgi:tetraacyldisaccharide 4'-kinase